MEYCKKHYLNPKKCNGWVGGVYYLGITEVTEEPLEWAELLTYVTKFGKLAVIKQTGLTYKCTC